MKSSSSFWKATLFGPGSAIGALESVGCTQLLPWHMANVIIKAVKSQSKTKYSGWEAMKMSSTQQWHERFVICLYGELSSQDVINKLFTGPRCRKCLLLDLCVALFNLTKASRSKSNRFPGIRVLLKQDCSKSK